jgi:Peptidase family M23
MSWKDMMRRVLPPIDGVMPDITSGFGEVKGRPENSTKPHRGVDFNYWGVAKLNRSNPAMRAPVNGIVTRADRGRWGTIAIRDADGFSHEILHSHAQHVTEGDPVVAGQLIGTMGNTGLKVKDPKDANHVHYQLRDPTGKVIDPSAYWDQRESFDPRPAPPALLNEHQRYLRILKASPSASANPPAGRGTTSHPSGTRAEVNASAPFGTRGQFVPGSAISSQPLYETRSFVEPAEDVAPRNAGTEVRRLVRLPASKPDLAGYDPDAPAPLPTEIPPVDRSTTIDDRFGNWSSSPGVSAPITPNQPIAPSLPAGRPPGLVPSEPMPDYPFPPTLFGFPGRSTTPGDKDFVWGLVRPPQWSKKPRQ